MMTETESLTIDQPYLRHCETDVTAIDRDERAFSTAVSHFYARGGGQPGDSGLVRVASGKMTIIDTWRDDNDRIWHRVDDDAPLPTPGESVRLELDWERRHRHMRMHSALHLLSVAVPAGVTSGAIHADRGRLDFDLPEPPDKAAIQARLDELIAAALPMQTEWISADELARRDDLVKTLSVAPPTRPGRPVRLVRFGDVDLQACGGTHVANSLEIGAVRVGKIEKKGRANRRINLVFAD